MASSHEINENIIKKIIKKLFSYTGYEIVRKNNFSDRYLNRVIEINDEDEDGFDFWANNDGSGMARFRELGAGWLHAFDGDFGKFIF